MASRNTLDMTNGPIFRKLLLYAYPLIINVIVDTLYNVADKIIAGRFIGDGAMAAVGVSSAPLNMIFNTFGTIASGVSVVCGNYIGARKEKELRECMHCVPVFGAILGLLVGFLGFVTAKPLLVSTNTPEAVFSDAYIYMLVRMIGVPFSMIKVFCTNILSSHGDTKRITIFGMLSGLINVFGNILFVTVIPLGITGIALATVLSTIFTCSMKLLILFSPKDAYRLRFSELRLHLSHLKQILSVGIPVGMNNLAFTFSNTMLQSSVNTFGPLVIAGNSCADTLISFVQSIPTHMSSACTCAVAQCFGAKNPARIKKVVHQGIWGTNAIVLGIALLITVFATPILRLFTDTPEVASAGIPKLMFTAWGYPIYVFGMIYGGALRGMRRSTIAMILSVFGLCLPRVLWVWFVFPFFSTPNMLYLIFPISFLICSIPLGIVYHRTQKKWAHELETAPAQKDFK